MKKTGDRLNRLIHAYSLLMEAFSQLDDPRLKDMSTVWDSKTKTQYTVLLKAGISASKLADGIYQALSETPAILDALPPDTRAKAFEAYSSVVERECPDRANATTGISCCPFQEVIRYSTFGNMPACDPKRTFR